MIYLFYFPSDRAYVYTTEEWFSSNFDSLEQLADVGFDDPGKAPLNDPDLILNPPTPCRLDTSIFYKDGIFLGIVHSFEELTIENHPELFI